MDIRPDLPRLIAYNCALLDQALHLVQAHEAQPGICFGQHSGPHLRHIVEHYEAFASQLAGRSVDYDSRARDRLIERDPMRMRQRIFEVQRELQRLRPVSFQQAIAVHQRGGLHGEENFISFSTAARELLFLASHAVHHYALIRLHGAAQGLVLGEDFGKAPATLHHERRG